MEENSLTTNSSLYTSLVKFNQNIAYIDGDIVSVDQYYDLLNSLGTAKDGDSFVIHINSGGGSVDTALQLCNTIKGSEAYVVAVTHGIVASAATFIALACDEVVVTPNVAWMIHPASYGMFGDVKSVRNETEFFTKYLNKLLRDHYIGFMTESEVDEMIEKSKDIWMDDNEVAKRLKRRNKYYKDLEKNIDK